MKTRCMSWARQRLISTVCVILSLIYVSLPEVASGLTIGANYGDGFIDVNVRNAFFFAENAVASVLPTFYAGEAIVVNSRFSATDTTGQSLNNAYAVTETSLINGFGSNMPIYNPDVYFTQALANHLHGSDLTPGVAEMTITFNTLYYPYFYYGTAQGTSQSLDFITIAMHELLHGLGFYIMLAENGAWVGGPSIYDTYLEQISGGTATLLTAMNDAQRAAAETANNLYWAGAYANTANGGNPVEMFAPSPYDPGSSIYHVDQTTFPQDLMRPYFDLTGFSGLRSVGGIDRGILYDIGWIPEPDGRALVITALLLVIASRRFFRSTRSRTNASPSAHTP